MTFKHVRACSKWGRQGKHHYSRRGGFSSGCYCSICVSGEEWSGGEGEANILKCTCREGLWAMLRGKRSGKVGCVPTGPAYRFLYFAPILKDI